MFVDVEALKFKDLITSLKNASNHIMLCWWWCKFEEVDFVDL